MVNPPLSAIGSAFTVTARMSNPTIKLFRYMLPKFKFLKNWLSDPPPLALASTSLKIMNRRIERGRMPPMNTNPMIESSMFQLLPFLEIRSYSRWSESPGDSVRVTAARNTTLNSMIPVTPPIKIRIEIRTVANAANASNGYYHRSESYPLSKGKAD